MSKSKTVLNDDGQPISEEKKKLQDLLKEAHELLDKYPIRTEIEVLPADETKTFTVGWIYKDKGKDD